MREDTSNITEQGGLEEGGVRVAPVVLLIGIFALFLVP